MTELRTPDITHKQQVSAAMGQLRIGATGEALALARQLAQQAPGDIDTLQLLAVCLSHAGSVAEAEQEFRKALRLAPAHPAVLSNLATLLRSTGRLAEAIPLWQRATTADPRFVQAWIDLGAAQLSAGDPEQAVAALERAIAQRPTSVAWHHLGSARRSTGDLPLAEIAFRNAIALDPSAATAWINLGAVLRLLGRAEEAIACYERAQALGYRGPELRDALVGALTDAGRTDDALTQARRLVSEQPAFAPGHRTLAGLLWEYGPALQAPEDPFAAFAQAADAQPANWALQLAHLGFLLEARKADEALDRIESLRRQQDSPPLMRMHADALDQIGRLEPAGALYAALYRTGDRSTSFLNAYARHLLMAGQWKEASERATEAVRQTPWDQQALANLGTAWRLLGDAREFWLCDYERLIEVVEVEPPPEFDSSAAFLDALGAVLDTMHIAAREPVAQSLRGGSQTPGQLFGRSIPLIEATRRTLHAAAENWLTRLPPDPAHPFLQRNSGGARFSGSWSVKLWQAGRHANHIHSQGWISSAFYVKLPPSVRAASSTSTAGCIQFGQPPLEMGLNLEPRRVVRPDPGMLVLFPSYFWHGTVPFDDRDPRVTVAFDLVPSATDRTR